MIVADKIHHRVLKLPEPLQAEVLDFVEFLLLKTEPDISDGDELDWSNLSLALAMRGMEDEDEPTYTLEDLKELF
jgi:hypothetical protein